MACFHVAMVTDIQDSSGRTTINPLDTGSYLFNV